MEYEYEQTKEFEIKEIAKSLTFRQQGLFLLMSIERKFMAYKEHSEGKEWNRIKKLNSMLENCWDTIINDTKYDYIMCSIEELDEDPEEWLYECQSDCPRYIIKNCKITGGMKILSQIVEYIYGMVDQIAIISLLVKQNNNDNELGVGVYNFRFLEDFLSYHSPELIDKVYEQKEKELLEEHELFCLEFEREKRDIEYLKTEKDLQKIYQRYHFDLQESILEDYWFDESSPKIENQQNNIIENKGEIAISEEQKKELDKEIIESCYKHGCIYTNLGRYEEAVQLFTEVIDLQPDNIEAYYNRAYNYMKLEKYQKAIADFEKVIVLNPQYENAYHSLGYIYNELQNHEKAVYYYKKMIVLNPNHKATYFNLGCIYSQIKDYNTAIFYYSKAIEISPDFKMAYFNRSNSYAALGQHKKSVDDLTKAIALNPDYADAYYNRADSYDELEEYEKAITDLTKVIALNPDFTEAYCNRGAMYNKLGEYRKAITDFDKAEKINPTIMQIYYNRGESYYALAEYEKAIADFSKVIVYDPNDKEAYLNRAKAYHAIGEIEKAIQDETMAKELQ